MATSGSFNTSGYDGRYLTFSWSLVSQSSENNQSVISWELRGAGQGGSSWYNAGNFKVVINGVTVYSSSARIRLYNGTLVSSGNLTISHNSDGSKSFTASAQAGIYYVAVNCTGSGSFSLPTIARYARITSVSNFNDTGTPSVSFKNPTGATLLFCLGTAENVSLIVRDNVSNPSSPYSFTLTETERNDLRALCPNSDTLAVRYTVRTYENGSIASTDYADATMTIVRANPTITGISYEDTNATTTAITGDDQEIIQNVSTVEFNFSSLAALKSATLDEVSITINGVTVTESLSGSSDTNVSVSFGTINSATNLNATIVIKDSRGNSSTYTKSITMLAWSSPTAIISCARQHNYYSETDLNVNADYSSLGGNNAITIQYQTREEGSSSWSALQSLSDGVTTTITLNNTESWDIKIIVADRLGSTTYNLSLDKGIPIIFFDKDKRSVGVNCFPDDNESLEVGGINIIDQLFYKSGDTYSVRGRVVDNGYIYQYSKIIVFTVTLPKSMANVTPTITALKVNGRHVGGGLIFGAYSSAGYDILGDPDITVSLTKEDDYITISLENSTAWSITNNTPVSMALERFEVSFS